MCSKYQVPEHRIESGDTCSETEASAGGSRRNISSDQAVVATPGEWVRYSSPGPGGAEYVAVCVPAFTPDTVHRDQGPAQE